LRSLPPELGVRVSVDARELAQSSQWDRGSYGVHPIVNTSIIAQVKGNGVSAGEDLTRQLFTAAACS
jgi:hypothetical protein